MSIPVSILGIDPSLSHTAFHWADSITDGEPHTTPASIKTRELKKYKHETARLDEIEREFTDFANAYDKARTTPMIAVIEGYAFGSKNKREALGELGGIYRLGAYRRGWLLLTCAPPTLKKFVLGKGTGEKDSMMMETLDKWGYKPTDNNDSDAYGLMRIGCLYWVAHYQPGFVATKVQQEILKKLTAYEPITQAA